MPGDKVLVTCATGKAGLECCRALVDAGFDVYGTTRNATSGTKISAIGAKPVIANYVSELPKALQESGAKKLLFITDFFKAGKNSAEAEYQQGVHAVDSAKAAGCTHTIFISVADCEKFPQACTHILAKPRVEAYLKEAGLKAYSILGAGTFFENFDDADNYNPLKKGALSFLMTESAKFCATYDIGRAAAVQFKAPERWHAKKLDVIGWVGDLDDAAKALEKVGGFPVKAGLAMPLFARKLFLSDLDAMCKFFVSPGISSNPSDFKKHVPAALDAEGWFRHHNRYGNGEPIVGNPTPPSTSSALSYLAPVAVAVAGSLVYMALRRS
jgi:uncharacterized protein YbjT (DUF2867 family)